MEVKSDQEIDLLTLLVKVLDFVWANLFLTIFLPVAGALVMGPITRCRKPI